MSNQTGLDMLPVQSTYSVMAEMSIIIKKKLSIFILAINVYVFFSAQFKKCRVNRNKIESLAIAELAIAELAITKLATADLATAELATAELATAELAIDEYRSLHEYPTNTPRNFSY